MFDKIMVKNFLNLKVKVAQLCLTLYNPMDYLTSSTLLSTPPRLKLASQHTG